jgi:hypothetical protein
MFLVHYQQKKKKKKERKKKEEEVEEEKKRKEKKKEEKERRLQKEGVRGPKKQLLQCKKIKLQIKREMDPKKSSPIVH